MLKKLILILYGQRVENWGENAQWFFWLVGEIMFYY